jgi:hypothetical protein
MIDGLDVLLYVGGFLEGLYEGVPAQPVKELCMYCNVRT